MEPRDRLIVALDVPSVDAAQSVVASLGDSASFYKIGYQLAFAGGLDYAPKLVQSGKRVFLDLKLHDIGNTVAAGVKSVARLGANFLTVHAFPQVMHAAVEARESGLRILAVTVLTSLAALRGAVKNKLVLVTPGIRPAGADAGDQKRIATPGNAINAGADYLVVGRPIIAASDPRAAAEAIVAEIARATPKD